MINIRSSKRNTLPHRINSTKLMTNLLHSSKNLVRSKQWSKSWMRIRTRFTFWTQSSRRRSNRTETFNSNKTILKFKMKKWRIGSERKTVSCSICKETKTELSTTTKSKSSSLRGKKKSATVGALTTPRRQYKIRTKKKRSTQSICNHR